MGERNLIQLYEYNTTSNSSIIISGWYQFTFIKKKNTFSTIYKSIGTSHDLEDTDDKRNLIQLYNTTP